MHTNLVQFVVISAILMAWPGRIGLHRSARSSRVRNCVLPGPPTSTPLPRSETREREQSIWLRFSGFFSVQGWLKIFERCLARQAHIAATTSAAVPRYHKPMSVWQRILVFGERASSRPESTRDQVRCNRRGCGVLSQSWLLVAIVHGGHQCFHDCTVTLRRPEGVLHTKSASVSS